MNGPTQITNFLLISSFVSAKKHPPLLYSKHSIQNGAGCVLSGGWKLGLIDLVCEAACDCINSSWLEAITESDLLSLE